MSALLSLYLSAILSSGAFQYSQGSAFCAPAVASPWFHYTTGVLVLGNFVVMCLYDPMDNSSFRAQALHITELVLAGVFLVECLLRILASGM